MKKRLLLFGLILTATCALSGCEFLLPSGSNQYTYKPTTSSDSSANQGSSSNQGTTSSHGGQFSSSKASSGQSASQSSSSSSQSAPPAGDLTAKKASYNYKHYVDNNVSAMSSTPCVGAGHLLVIPVWFTDSDNFISKSSRDNIRSDIETAYFGSNSDTGWRSVKTYYEQESHGALTLTGKVSSWYECGKSYMNYANDNGSVTATRNLVTTATNWYFERNGSDSRTNYDKDHDGYLDGVMLIYAAPDSQVLEGSSYSYGSNLWAYCYWVQNSSLKSVSSPGPNVFFWASYDFMYSKGTKALDRTGYASQFGNGDTSHCKVDAHTYIHEMGHVFGLDDYYDYSDNEYRPAGRFSMQDYNVGGHDPYSVYALGWGKAYIPSATTNIDLKPFQDSGEMILLSPSFNSDNSPFDEYLLLEYYTPTGLNEFDTNYKYSGGYPNGTKEYGIRLWHVDARLIYPTGINQAGDDYTYSFTSSANPTATNAGAVAKGVNHAMTNTYDDGEDETQGYLSSLGSGYYNYNLLQLIRNNTSANYRPKDDFSSSSLFKTGDTFTMETYRAQFVRSGKLNSNKSLGFSFTVNAIDLNRASITVTKL